ncbi:GNAT family N-acetyltransferase [Phaeovulum sp.]|uniref:GNAT family N-acetyltransferase n=1 Tax=Phaeovulum sp. TaxID=2934796 RepID=UPI003563AE03
MNEIELRDLAPGDGGWVIARHGALYAAEAGFDTSFEALVAEIIADFLRNRDPVRERGWIACSNGKRIGCVFCVRISDEEAKLRLFLLEPEARGRGLGRKLLNTCCDFARAQGYRQLRLWTHESHRAACALYAASGFTKVSSRPVHNYGQDLIEMEWQIAL